MDKYIGRLLDDRYEILDVLGTGGMAVVYKARCHRLNRLVAIKILKDDYLEDEEFRRRFHSESQAVAMLSHPNIVSIYDVSTSITADYIVMELIDGITLKQYMEKKGVLNWKETLHFAIQIAKALDHAHSKGIVHRDIKPHNIMVLKNGSVKVTDFGIARMMSKGNTLTKEALGSVHYISPEQAKGGRVDNRSDIYSLGVVMYEMMSGRPPYDGESPVAVAIQHINGGAVLPSILNPNIPGGLEQIIMKAMSREAADRYVSATQMLNDMDEFRKEPAILFDYNTPPLDEVTKLHKPPIVLENTQTGTTAEKVEQHNHQDGRTAGAGTAQRNHPERRTAGTANVQRRRPATTAQGGKRQPAHRSPSAAEKRSNVATIAIISCCLVMVVAIAIFLVTLFHGGAGQQTELAQVPKLVGKVYDDLPQYPGFEIKLEQKVYDDSVPAGQIIKQTPEAGAEAATGEKPVEIFVTVSLGTVDSEPVMPNVENWELSKAEQHLYNMRLNLQLVPQEEYHETIPAGNIIRTDPVAGSKLVTNQKIKIYISKGVEVKTAVMPDIIHAKKENAEKILKSQKLDLNIEFEEIFDSEVMEGYVVRTDPEVKEELKTGQTVTVYISKGPEKAIMPNVTGIGVDKAVNILKTGGFSKYKIEMVESDEEKDTVVRQSVAKDTEVDVNTQIILEVSKGPAQDTKPQLTKSVTLQLPDGRTEAYSLRIINDGVIVYETTVQPGQTTLSVLLAGNGTQNYDIYIDGQLSWTERVDFTS